MLSNSVARRYAAAFFELAQDRKELAEMEEQLQKLVATIEENRELKRVFYHRLIKPKDKKEVIKALFADKFSPILLNFIYLLIDKQREGHLDSILAQYTVLANEARNIMDAHVTSAIELTPSDLEDLQKRLSEATGKNVRLQTSVNPEIIGGLVIRVGDRVIDASLKKRLEMLKGNLMQASIAV